MKQIIALALAALFVIVLAGSIWLANAHMMPPTQTMERSIPDDHIPR